MSTYVQIYYHIVFSTKNREPVLAANCRKDLFRYIWGIIKNRQGYLYRINGTEDHLHMLSSLHPTCCLAYFVKDIKIASSRWIKENGVFPGFANWQDGYGASTHSLKDKDTLVEYIKNQEDHHRRKSFRDEFRALLLEAGVKFEERYLL